MILVLGGGFGLYGHVAALADMGAPVATLARYRAESEARPELAPLIERVDWWDDQEEALAAAEMICLARRPADNAGLAQRLAAGGRRLIIEKPIAPTPEEATALAETLTAHGCRFAVPYLFLHCAWFAPLADRIARGEAVDIRWALPGPGAASWKAAQEAGGGAIAFYLVHLLALIEALLPGAALRLSTPQGQGIAFEAEGRGRLGLSFALGAAPEFRIETDGATWFAAAGPFGAMPARGAPDPRLPALRRFYEMTGPGLENAPTLAFHAAVHGHWRRLAALYEGHHEQRA